MNNGAPVDHPERGPLDGSHERTGDERWYERGLGFTCTACGACCTRHGDASYVYVREDEVDAIAAHLGMERARFFERFCVLDQGWITLRPDLPECAFLDADRRCTIYPVRPVQCRTWPFWDVNIESRARWDANVTPVCPGSRAANGKVYDADRIETIARATEAWYEDELTEWPGLEPD